MIQYFPHSIPKSCAIPAVVKHVDLGQYFKEKFARFSSSV